LELSCVSTLARYGAETIGSSERSGEANLVSISVTPVQDKRLKTKSGFSQRHAATSGILLYFLKMVDSYGEKRRKSRENGREGDAMNIFISYS